MFLLVSIELLKLFQLEKHLFIFLTESNLFDQVAQRLFQVEKFVKFLNYLDIIHLFALFDLFVCDAFPAGLLQQLIFVVLLLLNVSLIIIVLAHQVILSLRHLLLILLTLLNQFLVILLYFVSQFFLGRPQINLVKNALDVVFGLSGRHVLWDPFEEDTVSVELTVALVSHVVLGTATVVEPCPGSPPKLENADVTNYCCHESENVGDEECGKIIFHIENREIE